MKKTKRPPQPMPDASSLESIHAFVLEAKAQPVYRAADKLYLFVNDCVNDPDFRHEQAAPLLQFLMIVRDVLTDGIQPAWTLEDIMEPIVEQVKMNAAAARMPKLDAINKRKAEAKAWALDYACNAWAKDAAKKIRIGEMAESLWTAMVDAGLSDALPDKAAGLSDWVRAIAPDYAKRGGRPRKTR